MSILIKNGRVITATDDYVADVFIDGETVAAIGKALPMKADRTIDASGKLVIPGAIDPHVHMELPFGGTVSSDTFETGTRAAAFGGTTTIVDFAIQYHGKTFEQTLDDWDAKAEGKCAIDYSYHLAVTEYEPSSFEPLPIATAPRTTSSRAAKRRTRWRRVRQRLADAPRGVASSIASATIAASSTPRSTMNCVRASTATWRACR